MRLEINKLLNTESGKLPLEIQLDIQPGKLVGIYGPSGCGKTMLLRCVAGLDKPDYGNIEFNGITWFSSTPAINLPTHLRNAGFLFQDFPLYPHLNVDQNTKIAAKSLSHSEELLKESGLTELRKFYPRDLSGGQRQRLALVQALAAQPNILLLDEPFSALDLKMRSQIQNLILKYQSEYNATVLLVSHLIEDLLRMTDRILEIRDGHIKQDLGKVEFLRKKADEANPENIIEVASGEAYVINGNHIQRV